MCVRERTLRPSHTQQPGHPAEPSQGETFNSPEPRGQGWVWLEGQGHVQWEEPSKDEAVRKSCTEVVIWVKNMGRWSVAVSDRRVCMG